MKTINLEELGLPAFPSDSVVISREKLESLLAASYYRGVFKAFAESPIEVCWKATHLHLDATPEQIEAAEKGLRKYAAERLAECINVIQYVGESAITGAKHIDLMTNFYYVNHDWRKKGE